MSTAIPVGLTELLEEFAVAVLREKPADLIPFAAEYFTNLAEQRRNTNSVQEQKLSWEDKGNNMAGGKDVEMMHEGCHD